MISNSTTKLTHGRAVSGVLQEYMEPLLIEWRNSGKKNPSVKELNRLLETPWLVWNAVVYHDCYPEADRHNLLKQLRLQVPDDEPEIKAVLDFFVARKRERFGQYRYLFRTCEFKKTESGEISCRAEICLPNGVDAKCPV